MTLPYQRELDFTIAILERMRVPVHLLHQDDPLHQVDSGFRANIGMHADYDIALRTALQWPQQRTIYKVLDQFMCNYIHFPLPAMPEPTIMIIGPYLTIDPTQAMLLEQTERLGLSLEHVQHQRDFYASLPVFHDPTPLITVVTCLGERIWGNASAFDVVDMNYEQSSILPDAHAADSPIEQENILDLMRQMEERYAYENELMEIVSKGLTNRAEIMISSVSQLNYQPRVPDPLRNQKNYCIICNTLLRKAAQQGGVHPFHLDKLSSNYARQIETAPTLESANQLISDMIRGYCRLVRIKAHERYSAIIDRTLTYIDSNLSGDLSLHTLAGMLQVTPSYLSALFHRETGHTLANHITLHRLKAACHLLINTRLQVQTVAQLSGFADPNYFSKRFKQQYGITPAKYRQQQSVLHQEG